MSKSEKMRHFRSMPSLFSLTDYATRLEQIMEKQPDGVALATLMNLIHRDRSILYEMIARFVPMGTTAEMVAFLQAFIAEEKNGDHVISEDGENAVEKIASAFLERGSELIQAGTYLDAAAIAFAIILAVEPELCFVYDEGWTYQMVISEAFDFLAQISDQSISPDTFNLLLQIATCFYNGRREEDRYFDHKWEEIILIFKKMSVRTKKPTHLYFYSAGGHLLWQGQAAAGVQTIPVSTYAKGLYLLKGDNVTEGIIVQ